MSQGGATDRLRLDEMPKDGTLTPTNSAIDSGKNNNLNTQRRQPLYFTHVQTNIPTV